MENPTLGGVELTADTTWIARYGGESPVAMTHETDIRGIPVIQISPERQGGDPIALSVRNCSFTLLVALRVLAANSLEGTPIVELAYHGQSLSVCFDFSEGHAVQGTPLRELPEYESIEVGVPFWTATVSLLVV